MGALRDGAPPAFTARRGAWGALQRPPTFHKLEPTVQTRRFVSMYVSLVLVIATMARMTTRSRAAAMITAAVGLRPKMVVRSVVVVERGSAEALSSLFVALSVLTPPLTLPLPLTEPLAAGAAGFAGVGSDGVLGVAGLASVAGLAPLCAIAAE